MIKCNMQANDMATTANNWQTPGASDPGRYRHAKELMLDKEDNVMGYVFSHLS